MGSRGTLRLLWESKLILMFILVPLLLLPVPYTIEGDAGKCAYAVLLLGVFWVFEVLPLPVTSLLPALLFPVLGILTTSQVSEEYTKDTTLTVIAIFCMVAGIERSGLNRRLALRILLLFGTKPHWLILGMLTCTTVLSMLLTVGVAIMLLPIVRTIAAKLKNVDDETDIEMNDVTKKSETEEVDGNTEHSDESPTITRNAEHPSPSSGEGNPYTSDD